MSGRGRDAIDDCAEDMLRLGDVVWDLGGKGEQIGAGIGARGEDDCNA